MVHRTSSYVVDDVPDADDFGKDYARALTVDRVVPIRGDSVVGTDRQLREKRSELPAHTFREFDRHGHTDAVTLLRQFGVERTSTRSFYRLADHDEYLVTFAETTRVPAGHVGLVHPTESLLTTGATVRGSAVGPNEHRTSAVLTVEDRVVLVEEDAAVAELVAVEAVPAADRADGADPD